MSEVREFPLVVPGPVRGWSRPRFNRKTGAVFTDGKAESYADQIQGEWRAAGRPKLPDGAYKVEMLALFVRPAGHFRKDGSLSAQGRRNQWVTRKPDLDNILKWMDALVAVGAVPDDRKAVYARVVKDWGERDELRIQVVSLVPNALAAAYAGVGVEPRERMA